MIEQKSKKQKIGIIERKKRKINELEAGLWKKISN